MGAIFLFVILNKYQMIPNEGYDALSVPMTSTVPVLGTTSPVGLMPTAAQAVMPASAPPGAPVQSTSTAGSLDFGPAPQPVDDGVTSTIGAWQQQPRDCYPKDQLVATDLLPKDQFSKWNAVNPSGTGDLANKNFLSAGYNAGVDTVSNTLRNASHDLRSTPPNPQQIISPFLQSTIMPDLMRKTLEIGGSC